jgi:hypothetical protein
MSLELHRHIEIRRRLRLIEPSGAAESPISAETDV